jgi:hypothetical protein
MGAAEWSSIVAAVAAVFGVLVPMVARRLEKQDRLARATYLIQLHGAYSELQNLQKRLASGDPVESGRSEEIATVLTGLRRDIESKRVAQSFRLFMTLAVLESFLFLGFAYMELSDLLARVLKGPSYETGLYFLEGIWGTSGGRSLLLAVCVASATALTLKLSRFAAKRSEANLGRNLILFGLFNGILVATTALVAGVLMILDPLVRLW